MVRVRTTAEVCEHYGKNPNDRKFVSRQVAKWLVVKELWWYSILEEKKKSDPQPLNQPVKQTQSSVSELEELRANYEYLHDKFMRMKRWYELVIELTYPYAVKNTKMSKSEYKEQLAEAVREQLSSEFWREE